MDKAFLDSAFSGGGGRVYGYRLRAITLRHMLALHMIDSPVLSGVSASDEDMVLACRILATRNDSELSHVLYGGLNLFAACGLWLRCFFYSFFRKRELAKFLIFQMGEASVPRPKKSKKKGKPMASPWLLVLATKAVKCFGVPLSEAWWLRFSDVCHATIAGDELDGHDVNLWNDKDVEMLKALGWTEEQIYGDE